MNDYEPPLIFISYARPDLAPARAIVAVLKDAGFSTWFDKDNLLGGQDWKYEIRRAIAGANLFVLCLSTNAVDRAGFYQAEMTYALEEAERVPQGKVYIMPVRLNPCSTPARIQKWQVVDIFEKDGAATLFRSITSALKEAARARAEVIAALNSTLRDFNRKS